MCQFCREKVNEDAKTCDKCIYVLILLYSTALSVKLRPQIKGFSLSRLAFGTHPRNFGARSQIALWWSYGTQFKTIITHFDRNSVADVLGERVPIIRDLRLLFNELVENPKGLRGAMFVGTALKVHRDALETAIAHAELAVATRVLSLDIREVTER